METLETQLENAEHNLRVEIQEHEANAASYRARIASLREQIAAEKAAAEKADPGMTIAKEMVTQSGDRVTVHGQGGFKASMTDLCPESPASLHIHRYLAARFNAEIARARQEGRNAMRDECVKAVETELECWEGEHPRSAIRDAISKLRDLK